MSRYYEYHFPRYVSVAARRAKAAKQVEKLRRKGDELCPVEVRGRKIAHTFWGRAWCDHLEKFSDYENRLPRGRSYVRGGLVCHLEIERGKVVARVAGNSIYNVEVAIKTLPGKQWAKLQKQCQGQIGSLLELLQGRISEAVMAVMTDRDQGLFPRPKEISFKCDCPDWARMCKHVAATLYAVGARLDESPELLFLLRGVNHLELISSETELAESVTGGKKGKRNRIAESELERVFGIEMAEEATVARNTQPGRFGQSSARPRKRKKPAAPRPPASRGKSKPGEKTPARAARKASSQAPAGQVFTGAEVAKLRRKLKLSRSRFAELLGVSPASVANWEKTRGSLNLHTRTRRALTQAARSKHLVRPGKKLS